MIVGRCPHGTDTAPVCLECFYGYPALSPHPAPEARQASEDEAVALARSLGLEDRIPIKLRKESGEVVNALGEPWRSDLVETIRAALSAARRRALEEAANVCNAGEICACSHRIRALASREEAAGG